MVFLKYVSDLFDAQSDVIRQRIAEPTSEYFIDDEDTRRASESAFIGDKTFYDQDNVFWIPKNAHFSTLLSLAAPSTAPGTEIPKHSAPIWHSLQRAIPTSVPRCWGSWIMWKKASLPRRSSGPCSCCRIRKTSCHWSTTTLGQNSRAMACIGASRKSR